MTNSGSTHSGPANPANAQVLDQAAAAAVRAQWLEDERSVRARLGAPGKIDPAELAKHSGMEILRRISSGELPSPLIGGALDFFPLPPQPGVMMFQGTPRSDYYNPIGSIHGGYVATLLDSAVGCSVHTLLPRGMGYTTLELKVNYLRALTDRVGPVRAVGTVVNMTRQTALAEGRLVDSAGRLYAWASTTCLLFPLGERAAGA